MIASLTGVLAESEFTGCVVDVHGVGYELSIPLSTFDKLPQPGSEVSLFVHTQVREDAITLFGFASRDERELFRILIGATGVGGKLALNILSAMPVGSFCAAIVGGDLKTLSRISGIGKRTAERLVVELKNRLAAFHPEAAAEQAVVNEAFRDALAALEQLGFKRDAADRCLQEIVAAHVGEELDSAALLRQAVMKLNS